MRADRQRSAFLVEHYGPGTPVDELQREAREVRAAAGRMAREGMSLQDVRCAVVPRDEGFICIFEAASEELVREAYRRAGVGFDRISAALGG